ncbi:MAG: hypothetical protein IT565_08830 [Rhodospirillales bacterium]|nr:hypothetical protein [Rhodospirillales bacterium]
MIAQSAWLSRVALAGSAVFALAGLGLAGEVELGQKLQALARLLASPTAAQIDQQGAPQAQDKLAKARALKDMADVARRQGKIDEAEQQAGEALRLVSEATVLASWRQAPIDARRARYRDLADGIAAYRDSFDEAARAKGPAAARLLDRQRLADLLAKADSHAATQRWDEANAALETALVLVENATIDLRNNDTVVYAQSFQTPRDEFRFESERYAGTFGLVQQRLKDERLGPDARRRAQSLIADAENQRGQALGLAGNGDYEKASRMLEEAQKRLLDAAQALGAL